MSKHPIHAAHEPYRALLLHREAIVQRDLHTAHQRAVAAIQPHVDALLRELADKQATLDEGETIPLIWLRENHRIARLQAVISAHIDAYSRYAHGVAVAAQREGATLGAQAAHAAMHASVPAGVQWTFKQAREKSR